MRHLLSPPTFTDEEQTRVARLLHWILLILLSVNFLNIILVVALSPETIFTLWFIGAQWLFYAVGFWLLRRGNVRLASLLVVLMLWSLLAGYITSSGGLSLPVFNTIYVIIVIGTMLLGISGALLIGLLSVALACILYWGQTAGWLAVQPNPPPIGRVFVVQMLVFFGFTTLLSINAWSIHNALNRARKGERDLADRNQQLRDEITRREKAQRDQFRLATILETTSDFVAIVGTEGRTTYLNSAGRKLMGIGEFDDITEMTFSDYHPPEVSQMMVSVVLPIVMQRGIWSGENILLTRDSKELPISQVVIAHKGTDGTVEYFSTVIRDLSDHKEAEQSRLELALQKERVELFKEFIGNISHDLRTPLTVINTSLHLLERTDDPQRRQEKADNIRQQTARLERLIQDLLTLARLDQAPMLSLTPLRLNSLLTDIKNHIAPTAENKQLTLRFDLDDRIPLILADERELYRALANLVENAVNYTAEGGSVIVETHLEAGQVIAQIRDTGIGIPPEELSHIFERFYRVDQARKLRSEGTGLGLAIVKRIVEMHNGGINVESQPGVGTIFSLNLPALANAGV